MIPKVSITLAIVAVLLSDTMPARAQWQTQSLTIKPGWTAVYLHVDPSYTNLNALVGGDPKNPIAEVWLWEPAGTIQYVTSPQAPITGSSQWATWTRGGTNTTLATLVPNAAYLVHSLATTNYTWTLKGRPAAPSYTWTTTGLNLLGFPTVTSNAPPFDRFLSCVPDFQTAADIYQYVGGDLSANNPIQVFAPHSVTVTRGTAFWIRSGSYFNNYFGPFQVGINTGVDFGAGTSRNSFHLRNTTPLSVTVTLSLLPSETPPAGQTSVLGLPPLVVRGALNATNLTYSVSNLTASSSLRWTLAPEGKSGSDIVINLGVDRTRFASNAPGLYAGILKFTDSFGYTEVDVPVSAQPASYSGLWVGGAAVSQVANYLKTYATNADGLVQGADGAYVVTGVNTNLGAVSSRFPLRLIVHNSGTSVSLMQRVFYGSDVYSNTIVTTSESKLDPAKLANARRITAVQFPWTANNQTWPLTGPFMPGGTLTATVDLPYDDQAANPFLHTYHPDHDNLDATFQNQLPVGSESYGVRRDITMSFSPAGGDYDSLTQFGQSFSGNYAETITMTGLSAATRTFNVAGLFTLNCISTNAVLTRP
jgi:hypothetical protein